MSVKVGVGVGVQGTHSFSSQHSSGKQNVSHSPSTHISQSPQVETHSPDPSHSSQSPQKETHSPSTHSSQSVPKQRGSQSHVSSVYPGP